MPNLGQRKKRVMPGNPYIAGYRQLQSATNAIPLDSRDGQAGQCLDTVHEAQTTVEMSARLRLRALGIGLEIITSTEGLYAFPS